MIELPQARLKRIFLVSVAYMIVLTLAAFIWLPDYAWGVLAGGAIGSLNYALLVRFARRVFDNRPKAGQIVARVALRYAMLGGLIALAAFVLRVDVVGLAVGISNIPAAIGLESVFPAPDDESGDGGRPSERIGE